MEFRKNTQILLTKTSSCLFLPTEEWWKPWLKPKSFKELLSFISVTYQAFSWLPMDSSDGVIQNMKEFLYNNYTCSLSPTSKDKLAFDTIDNVSFFYATIYCGVPHGSISGPLLFSIYRLPSGSVFRKYNISSHCQADDIRLTSGWHRAILPAKPILPLNLADAFFT